MVTFLDAASEKTLRSTVALTASRGRGKVRCCCCLLVPVLCAGGVMLFWYCCGVAGAGVMRVLVLCACWWRACW